jgi:hypothetical protein
VGLEKAFINIKEKYKSTNHQNPSKKENNTYKG